MRRFQRGPENTGSCGLNIKAAHFYGFWKNLFRISQMAALFTCRKGN
jgi:hypothetical protein